MKKPNKACKCEHCNIPLSGWRYNLIVKPLFKIKRATPSSSLCNKCNKKKLKK